MKRKYIYQLTFVLALVAVFSSCKKEVTPTLTVTVKEKDGTIAPNASVHVHPGNASQQGSIIDEAEMDKTTTTNSSGQAVFEFKYSAVLDVDVIYYKEYLDASFNMVTDTMMGHRVVKIEVLRQNEEENNFIELVEVK